MSRSRTSLFSTSKIGAIIIRADSKCEWCGESLNRRKRKDKNGGHKLESIARWRKRFVLDHIVPRSKGGSLTDASNIALSCKACNLLRPSNSDIITDRFSKRESLFINIGRILGDILYTWAPLRRKRQKHTVSHINRQTPTC